MKRKLLATLLLAMTCTLAGCTQTASPVEQPSADLPSSEYEETNEPASEADVNVASEKASSEDITLDYDIDMDGSDEHFVLTGFYDEHTDDRFFFKSVKLEAFDKNDSGELDSIYVDELSGDNFVKEIQILKFDDETTVLALCDNGPSADPITYFYAMSEYGFASVGYMPAYVSQEDITDGVLLANIGCELIQTDSIGLQMVYNKENGIMEELPVPEYDFRIGKEEGFPNTLNLELDAYASPDESSAKVTIQPQHISIKRVTSDMKWIYIVAEDGTQGYVPMSETKSGAVKQYEDLVEESVYEETYNVFSDLYLAG